MPENQLANETSPYLQQHADNPVNWYAWNNEALKLAKESNKPILLSIGYSACHWCHVMAHESFEDEATADVMNQLYVNIKVDREERPDLDKIYQTAHYLLTQRNGGWPLTVFLTPDDQIPFFAGTYFPTQPQHGLPGFKDILQGVAEAFENREADIRQQNQSVQQTLDRVFTADSSTHLPSTALLSKGYNQLLQSFDPQYGGFGKAPKFPHPSNIDFLLHLAGRQVLAGDAVPQAQKMAISTLEKMASGGIFDQIGAGFCRYSVDEHWLIPHFEKMLYDNGPLLSLYSKSYSQTGNKELAATARTTADWVIREMQSPEGGYYSSFDADSEGKEGKFYVWTPKEIQQHLTNAEYDLVSRHLGLDKKANFEGCWHLHRAMPLTEVADELGLDNQTAEALLASARKKLYEIRSQRIWPGRDEKILLSWNALTAKGMLHAAWHCQNPDFSDSAMRALNFIRAMLWKDNRLLATYKDRKAHLNAYLDDYAFLLDTLIVQLSYQWDSELLNWAIEIADCIIEQFEDKEQGGFFFTSSDHEQLIQRPKALMDEATPSGYAIAVQSLQILGWLLGKQQYLDTAERGLKAASNTMQQSPVACVSLLIALQEHLDPPDVIILRGNTSTMSSWQAAVRDNYSPGRLCFAISNEEKGLPDAISNKQSNGDCIAYICQGTTCSPPVENLDKFILHLKQAE